MATNNIDLRTYLQKVLAEYRFQKNNPFKGNEFSNFIRKRVEDIIPDYLFPRVEYKIHSSCGQGNWAEIPWVKS